MRAGRKTQTRRVIRCWCNEIHPTHHKRLLGDWGLSDPPHVFDGTEELWNLCGPAPKVGDWIEKYQIDVDDHATAKVPVPYGQPGDVWWMREPLERVSGVTAGAEYLGEWAHYQDDGEPLLYERWQWNCRVLSARYMPAWAARDFRVVTDVRAQRLWEITDEDCIAEGIEGDIYGEDWDSINAKRGYPWSANNWVWAYTSHPATAAEVAAARKGD